MTAMPPTTGHLQLIQFANQLGEDGVVVILGTQPEEPMSFERAKALRATIRHHGLRHVRVLHVHQSIEQDPRAPGFWEMWRNNLLSYGVTPDDYIVASEKYGQKLAELTGAQFFPYDIERVLNHVKATPIRDNPLEHFNDIIPEFQPYLRTRVTIFGAESTGKTTLSRALSERLNALWLYEYARPYLENTVNEITTRSMTAIWKGQAALQRHADELTTSPYILQDTDLYSTVGYWQFPHWQPTIGECPEGLVRDARTLQSDLYIVTRSNIPFEQDPLRYGGTVREGSDEYWINICEKYELPYIVLDSSDPDARLKQAERAIRELAKSRTARIAFDRHGL